MRIRITGEKPIIEDLGAELRRGGAEVESAEGSIDRAELPLGLLEVAAVTTIAVNIAKLIEHLVVVARHLKDEKKRRLEIKTGAETTLVEIDNKSTRESLEKQLSIHNAPSAPVSAAPNADKKS